MQDVTDPLDATEDAMALVFRLDGEAFAIPVAGVHEILDPQEPTQVPNAGATVPGLINVRGVVVPVFDIRHRLTLAPADAAADSRMIVFEHQLDGVPQKVAFTADAVEQVIDAPKDALRPLPDLGASWPRRFIAGALKYQDDLVVFLDPETLFAPPDDRSAAA